MPVLPKVSLIISNFNGRDMLRDCVNSLRELDYPSYEVIVVDAASTDGTPDMIKTEFPEVILVESKRKVGVGQAINIGLEKSTGEIIAFDLNNDELFPKSWLRTLVDELLLTDKKKVVGGTRLIYQPSGIVDSAGVKRNIFGQEMQVDAGKRISTLPTKPQEVDYVGCPVFHRTLLDEIKKNQNSSEYCDEKYIFYFEDTDFCEIAKRLGYKILNVYSAVSYHRRSATVTTISAKAYYYLKRGRIRFMIKYFSPIRLFFGSMWWFSTALFDAVWYSASIQRLLRHSGFQKTGWEPRTHAVIEAIYWNLTNIRDHFKARKVCNGLQVIQSHSQKLGNI